MPSPPSGISAQLRALDRRQDSIELLLRELDSKFDNLIALGLQLQIDSVRADLADVKDGLKWFRRLVIGAFVAVATPAFVFLLASYAAAR